MTSSQRFELIFTTLLNKAHKMQRMTENTRGYNLYIEKKISTLLPPRMEKFQIVFYDHLLAGGVSECIISCNGFLLASLCGWEGFPNFGKIHRLENIIEGYYLSENPQDSDIDLPQITNDQSISLSLIKEIEKHIEMLINHSK